MTKQLDRACTSAWAAETGGDGKNWRQVPGGGSEHRAMVVAALKVMADDLRKECDSWRKSGTPGKTHNIMPIQSVIDVIDRYVGEQP